MARGTAVFEARGLTKVYHVGEVEICALRDVDLDLPFLEHDLTVRVRASP